MITKTKIWKKIKLELKEFERSKVITEQVMKRIKEIRQDENKD